MAYNKNSSIIDVWQALNTSLTSQSMIIISDHFNHYDHDHAQQTFAWSKSTIETLEKNWKMFKVNTKDNGDIIHKFFWCFYYYFEKVTHLRFLFSSDRDQTMIVHWKLIDWFLHIKKIDLKPFHPINVNCTSKGFMMAFRAFIKPFEAPQRSVKVKI